jgi:lysophospholipase L1-like esterase
MTLEQIRRSNVVFPYFPAAYGVLDFLDLIASYNDAIRRVAQAENVPLIDLAQAFESEADVAGYFLDTMHTTREGAQLIAQRMLRDLEQQGLLD